MSTAPADASFDCPRCGRVARARFWGPCLACRDELTVRYRAQQRDVVAEEYVPKMNVTPNQVAFKE